MAQSFDSQLWRLVLQALELQESPYYLDACQAILELGYRKREIEEQEFHDGLQDLDPFIRRCVYLILKLESDYPKGRKAL